MSDIARVFVVEGDEGLNRNLVNALRKDGYGVQSVTNGMDAVRVLRSEEYNVVICDLKTPGIDGFELLQWLRAYYPNTRMILVGAPGSGAARMQALENGAASYLETPLDIRVLKEELRRLVQQTGFSASLDSFDLLDVIQVITMSRKSITLLVNTGLEERGMLRFHEGELIWAEYSTLQGEEAFFALAAHKNGTVFHQPWDGYQMASNVTQPLSRLILQALQYRTKYAHGQEQLNKELKDVVMPVVAGEEVDDRPFMFTENGSSPLLSEKEELVHTGSIAPIGVDISPPHATDGYVLQSTGGAIMPSKVHKTSGSRRVDLPSWLANQPTPPHMSAVSNTGRLPILPVTPIPSMDTVISHRSSSPEWQALEQESSSRQIPITTGLHKAVMRTYNYSALVSALQTVGYSVSGFIAAAVVSMDGRPITQVVVDDLDISGVCKRFSTLLQGVLQSFDQEQWGSYEQMVITSSERHILIDLVEEKKNIFQVLITTHEADPVESLNVMANVEGAISAALG
jgi:DNA-binding response OmpR family regulator/predicted regulator of Ras-like GTPase activity (Roadblock/LC7/MglB family)